MGHEIELIALNRGHNIIAKIDNQQEWNDYIDDIKKAEVAIEFSLPATAVNNINKCFDISIPIVCGTTGWYQHLDSVKTRCEQEKQTLFYAPNFSIGMNFVFQLNKQLAAFSQKYNYQEVITETHHIHKIDKPSGTAIKLAEEVIAENNNYDKWQLDAAYKDNILQINAIREGECFGIHEIKAFSDYDEILLRHKAFNRKGLANGAVIAAEFIKNKKGCFTMNDLLH